MPVKTCYHIRTDGRCCGSPVLKRRNYCYFHFRMNQRTQIHRQLGAASQKLPNGIDVPFLEDLRTVQIAVTDVLRAIATERVTAAQGSVLLRGLRFAAHNLQKEEFSEVSKFIVHETEDDAIEGEAFQTYISREVPKTNSTHKSNAPAQTQTLSNHTHADSIPAQTNTQNTPTKIAPQRADCDNIASTSDQRPCLTEPS